MEVAQLSSILGGPLPFAEPQAPASTPAPWSRPPAAAPAPAVRPPNPAAPSTPPPVSTSAAPAPAVDVPPATSLPSLPVETHARVRAALLDGEPLDAALAELELDEVAWRLADRRLAIDLAREAAEGRNALAMALEEGIRQAQRPAKLGPEDEEAHDFESYVAIRVELEESGDPPATLRDLGLTTEDWDAMRRRWRARAIADRATAANIREALAEARRELRAQRA